MISQVISQKGKRTAVNYTIGSSPVLIASQNLNRKSIVIQNQGSGTVYLGPDTVDSSGSNRGYALFSGATFTDNASNEAWYAVGSSSDVVHVIEVT